MSNAAGDSTSTFRAVASLTREEAETLKALRKRKGGSFGVDAVLKHPDFPVGFEGTTAWFDKQSPDVQEQYLADHPPPPKPPRAAPVAEEPRHGALMKKAIRQAWRENPNGHLIEIAEAADRNMEGWKINFREECPPRWRRKKSIAAALGNPDLKAAVKTYFSKLR